MDTINNDLTNLLQQMGVHQESLGITQRIVMIAVSYTHLTLPTTSRV